MLELTVENKNGVLVVDSRLIAEELGIEHRSLIKTIETHLQDIEQVFGAVVFEITSRADSNKGGKQPRIAYLTEEQATFVMTLSRNTVKVVQAKIKLVKAFGKAKQALQSINPELLTVLSAMNNRMNFLAERTQKLDDIEKSTNNNRGIKGVIETDIQDIYSEDVALTVKEYLEFKGVDLRYVHILRKRAIQFYRNGTQNIELPKKGGEIIFKGANVGYLDQALKTVLGLD
jgi:Uncharacterized phage-encoded protein